VQIPEQPQEEFRSTKGAVRWQDEMTVHAGKTATVTFVDDVAPSVSTPRRASGGLWTGLSPLADLSGLKPGPGKVACAAIISDTHMPRGERRLPESCLARLCAADLILHAGDISTADVLDELAALGPVVLAVHGNVDELALRERLPSELEIELGGARLAMTHDAGPASGRVARLRRRFPAADAVVFGHSHIPLLEREHGFQIFNPGSPTDRRRQSQHTIGLARIADERIVFEHVALD
jgi:uncharacterized protein